MQISDRVTVMRDGHVVDTVEKKNTSEVDLARMMVGRDVFLKNAPPSKKIGDVVLKVENISAVSEIHHRPVLRNVSLKVHAGEILGVAGIDGNGQSELVRALIGLQKLTDGKILLHDQEITHLSTRGMRESGIGVIPEDRLEEGLVIDFDVQENLCLGLQRHETFTKNGRFDWNSVTSNANELVEKFDIRTPSIFQLARLLSGGNQQKVIVAREIFHAPDMIIAAQPTRGLDIAATDFVHEQLVAQRDLGKAVLLLSLSLEEVMLLSTRIAVIYKGENVPIIDKEKATAENLGLLLMGGSYEHIPA